MNRLDQRLTVLEELAPEFLMDFWEPHLSSFSIQPGGVQRVSITSTCYSIRAMLASDENSSSSTFKEVDVKQVLKVLLNSSWREDDIYQVSLMLLMLLRADPTRSLMSSFDSESIAQISKLISLVLTARPKRRSGEQQVFSNYISYLCCSVYAALFDSTHRDSEGTLWIGGLSPEVVPTGTASELSLALSRSGETSFNELCRQMAYRSSGDSTSFDITRLAYSLLSYLRATASLQGTAGRENVSGEGPDDGSKPLRINRKLVVAALAAFFEEQQDDGIWDRGQPIYKSFRRKGRNIGNAYVFVIDTLGSLLEILPAEDFRPHLRELEHTLGWIESEQTVEIVSDYCDAESGQCKSYTRSSSGARSRSGAA
jgi:hypothetical protein